MMRLLNDRFRAGFAIPAAILVIVVVSILALSGLYLAQNNLSANMGMRRSWKALNAADAGAAYALATWNDTVAAALNPGDSLDAGWRTLSGGSVYRTVVLRVDDATPGKPELYRLRTVGRPGPNTTAQRVLVTMVRGMSLDAFCCDGAAQVQGPLTVRGSGVFVPRVSGVDTPPGGWGGCPAQSDIGGISIQDATDVTILGAPIIEGSPPIEEDTTIDSSSFFEFGDLDYDDLARQATKVYSGSSSLTNLAPSTSGGGGCNTSDPNNWGDPLNPGSACWDYIPIIHVTGDLALDGVGAGQGLLLVDGNLELTGNIRFFGIAVVLGSVFMAGTAEINGGLLVRNGPNGTLASEIRGRSVMQYSSCAAWRIFSQSVNGVKPLDGRHWFEVMN
ncbi:MAG: hypothetical protein V3S60_04370 [Acidimicrobiia bacterium]